MTKEEIRRRQIMLQRKAIRMKRLRRKRAILIGCMLLFFVVLVGGIVLVVKGLLGTDKKVGNTTGKIPDWIDQQFLVKNPYSRPGDKLEGPKGIVVHYTANAGTSAQQNRDFFNNLAVEKNNSVSSHFVIGIDGEIIQCIPLDEIAYTSNNRNNDTISIENCHLDETGEFTEATYKSLVKLTAWLSIEFNIKEDELIRHYDVNKKPCPKYYVDNEDKWLSFKEDVKAAISEMKLEEKSKDKQTKEDNTKESQPTEKQTPENTSAEGQIA